MSEQKVKYIKVKVIPKSSENRIMEEMEDGTLKIRIKAVPEKGKANTELIKFLAKEFGVDKDTVKIISGKSERIKLLSFRTK